MAEEKKVRDFWDKFSLTMGIITAILVPAFGWQLNIQQNKTNELLKQQELVVSRANAIEKYLAHLDQSVDPARQMAALAVIFSLGYKKEAILIAKLYPSERLVEFLKTIAIDPKEPLEIQKLGEDAIKSKVAAGGPPEIQKAAEKALATIKGPWGVVIGYDENLKAAQDEQKRALKNGYQRAEIYLRQNAFQTVIPFDNKERAQENLKKIHQNIREDSYIVNLENWCKKKEEKDGYYQCIE